ncbi:MAG: hypothetical protein J07HX64_02657 [halophilic archaeon J07HX64]|nr:MAG: hypothetical protein J07HX64_02657 [halophilic archaeon J07HX64]
MESREALAGVEQLAGDVGSSDEHSDCTTANGVAFAAIRGLSQELDETRLHSTRKTNVSTNCSLNRRRAR